MSEGIDISAGPGGQHDAAADGLSLGQKTKRLSGLYRGMMAGRLVELRIDLDGPNAMMAVSGDIHAVQGTTRTWLQSFKAIGVGPGDMQILADRVRIVVQGDFRPSASHPFVLLDIFMEGPDDRATEVQLQLATADFKIGLNCLCKFVGIALRSIRLEVDTMIGSEPLGGFDTKGMAPGLRRGIMTIARAYADAGLELKLAGLSNSVPPQAAGADARWSDAELAAVMASNRTLPATRLGLDFHMLVASRHEEGLRGLMFDLPSRFGCAVFQHQISELVDTDPHSAARPMLVRTAVHEMGHCLGLGHPGTGSWMGVPERHPAGPEGYWKAFALSFDPRELLRLRHGFLPEVAAGGDAFSDSGSTDDGADGQRDTGLLPPAPCNDQSGLQLMLRVPTFVGAGLPVVAELLITRLRKTATRPLLPLHPKAGHTKLWIKGPDGRVRRFRPMARSCGDSSGVCATSHGMQGLSRSTGRRVIQDSAFVGHDARGPVFPVPGRYVLVASHACGDGSMLVSNRASLVVGAPRDRADDRVAALSLGDSQGELLTFLGSDSDHLGEGIASFGEIEMQFPEHPMATYIGLIKGVNAARSFKSLSGTGRARRVCVRNASPSEALRLLEPILSAAMANASPLDAVSLGMVAQRLDAVLMADGSAKRAKWQQKIQRHAEKH